MTLTQISTNGIKDANVNTADIADEAITLAKLAHGTSSNNGKFLRANNGADPTFETVNTDLVADSSPQLGGNLDTNSNNIDFGDSSSGSVNRLRFGASTDLEIFHNGTNNHIDCHTAGQDLFIRPTKDVYFQDYSTDDILVKMIKDGAVELYHNDVKQLETFDLGIDIGTSATGNFGIRWGGTNFNYCNIWSEHGSGDLFLAGGLKPKVNNSGFFSSYTGSFSRNAIQIDAFGNNGIHFYTSAAQNVTKDDAITVKEHLRIEGDGDLRLSSDDVGSNYGFIDGWTDSTKGNFIISADHGTTGQSSSTDGSAILFKTRAGERARIQHAGGISFNGDTSQDNALDDYEEGTWTPDFRVHNYLNNANSFTYTTRTGFYTKIGRQVHIHAYWVVSDFHTYTGNLYLFGLPFAPAAGGQQPLLFMFGDHANFSGTDQMGMAVIVEGGNGRGVVGHQMNGGWSHMTRSEMDGGGGYLSGTYYV